jgi:UrcA family protein
MTFRFDFVRCFVAASAAAMASALTLLPIERAAAADADAAPPPSVTVHFDRHELSTHSGTRAVYERLATAARAVCPTVDTRDLAAYEQSRKCRRVALEHAVQAIDDARLTTLLASQTSEASELR